MVSHPETGLDSPIGSDRDRGRDRGPLSDIEMEIPKNIEWLLGVC